MIIKALIVVMSAVLLSGCMVPGLGEGSGPRESEEFIKGDVVKDFPQIPLYEESRVIESYSKDGNHGAVAVVNAELSKVIEFYRTGFDFYKWEHTLRQKTPTNYVFDIRNSEHEGNVYVNTAADGKTTAITITVNKR